LSAGDLLQTPLGELTALPRPSSWILRGYTSKEGGEERGGKGRRGREGIGLGLFGERIHWMQMLMQMCLQLTPAEVQITHAYLFY